MGYSNVIDLVGSVRCVYREKTKEYTDLRIALRTTTPLGWQTTIPCVYRFWKGEKIPPIRKGTWLGLFGTVRFSISPEGRQQAYVQMLNEPTVVLGKSDRIMLNEMVAGGCLHAFNRGDFNEADLEANFLLRAQDPPTGFIYEYCCVVPDYALNNIRLMKDCRDRILVRGSLMMLYDPEDDESSACCIIADRFEHDNRKRHHSGR